MNIDKLFKRAKKSIPGGVCASTRLNQALGKPMYVSHANGSRFVCVDGKVYIDMCCSHGASLLGHGHPAIKHALATASELGICCSFDTVHHVELAEKVCSMIPSADRVRFTNSGSEATLHALRLCRAYTGKDRIIRFTGHFHGYHEFTFIGGHPPKEAMDNPSNYRESSGIPAEMTKYILALPFNDLAAFEKAIRDYSNEICAVIMEPVDFNSGCILPNVDYLQEVRRITQENGIILFFDEIQSSFKKSVGGAQYDFGVTPDICTIGKSLGGGTPLSAICGKAEIMDRFKPIGDVAHSGTFNAHLTSILAGNTFCDLIVDPKFYKNLESIGNIFYSGVDEIISRLGLPVVLPHHGARFGILMGLNKAPTNYADTLNHRTDIMLAFIRKSAELGVYFHDYGGGAAHHGFSIAHNDSDITRVLEVFEESLKSVKDMFDKR